MVELPLDELRILGRIGLAALLGALVGVERELRRKPAGIRTHMLVAGGAALLVLMGDIAILRWAAGPHADVVQPDPVRVVHAVVLGIGFLGAGTIAQQGKAGDVEGLTTAASIWLVTGLGVAVAVGMLQVATVVAVVAVLAIAGVGWLERRLGTRDHRRPLE